MASAPLLEAFFSGLIECADAVFSYLNLQDDEDHAHELWQADLRAWELRRAHNRANKKRYPCDDIKPSKPTRTSLRTFASFTNFTEGAIRYYIRFIRASGKPQLSARAAGRPRYLEPWEDEALVRYTI